MSTLNALELGELYKRFRGITDKVENGGLDLRFAIEGLRQVFEGRIVLPQKTQHVPQEVSIRYLRPIPGADRLKLKATGGTRYVGKEKKVFPGYIDGDFQNWGLNVTSQATPEMDVRVEEQDRDGKFLDIYHSVSLDLNQLCLSQHQIVDFVVEYESWLRTDGYATFFLFKEKTKEAGEKEPTEKFFVARVRWRGRKLKVFVYRVSYDCVWGAKYRLRFVLPQLAEPSTA